MTSEGKNGTLPASYIVGFTEGEGCFCVVLRKTDGRIDLRFFISQAEGNTPILQRIRQFFGVGAVYQKKAAKGKRLPAFVYEAAKRDDVYNVIIPFFKGHKLQGTKADSFEDFCKIAEIVRGRQNTRKLTSKELEKVRLLKLRMNKRYGSPGAGNPLTGSGTHNNLYEVQSVKSAKPGAPEPRSRVGR